MLTNEEAAKVHKHLIKRWIRLWKKKGECHICYAPSRRCLEVYFDVRERWLLAWNQNKHIMYYMFHILIPKSVLLFHTFALTSFDDSDFIIALALVLDWPTSILVRAVVTLLTFRKSILLAPLRFNVFRAMQIPDPFHFHLHHPRCHSSYMIEDV